MAGSRSRSSWVDFIDSSQFSLGIPPLTPSAPSPLPVPYPNVDTCLGDTPGPLGVFDHADPNVRGPHLTTKADWAKFDKWWQDFEKKLPLLVDGIYDFPGTERTKGKHKNYYSYGGYEKYGGGSLSAVICRMRDQKVFKNYVPSDADINALQRVANAETAGEIMGINTWDNMVLSWGFKQWTLGYGELQDLIKRVPDAFRKYHIEIDETRSYHIVKNNGKGVLVPAIKGVYDPGDLRGPGWAIRFYRAGLDQEIIVAEVEKALEQQIALLKQLKNKYNRYWSAHLHDGRASGLILEVDNNRPASVLEIMKRTHEQVQSLGGDSTIGTDKYIGILRDKIKEVYGTKAKERQQNNWAKTHKENEPMPDDVAQAAEQSGREKGERLSNHVLGE